MPDLYDQYRAIERSLTGEGGGFTTERVEHCGRQVLAYRERYPNLVPFFCDAEVRFGERVLLWEDGATLSYAEVFTRARRLAAALASKHSIGPGSMIGLVMRNRSEWFEGFIASQWLGATAVLFNSRSSADELGSAVGSIPCDVILADRDRAAKLAESGAAATIILPQQQADLIDGADGEADPAPANPAAPTAILFTSGTTGRAKGATLTQFNLGNLAKNSEYAQRINMQLAADAAGIMLDVLEAKRPQSSGLLIAPLFHISGISVFLSTLNGGGKLAIMRRWDPDVAMDMIAEHSVSTFTGPPLVLADLVNRPGAPEKLATLTGFSIAGQATPGALLDKVRAILPRVSPSTGWGGTESCGSIAAASGAFYMLEPGCAGTALPISELSIRDENGNEVAAGELGEIWVKSGLVMLGYWGNDEATAESIADGWYKSGDIGRIDERGFLFIVDRLKDMVISSGENIYCAEVERVIGGDPAVAEIAVFGVPDPRLGERAIAAVNLEQGTSRSEDDLKRVARDGLAEYKVPRHIAFDLGEFPRTATGKTDKVALRQRYLERHGETA